MIIRRLVKLSSAMKPDKDIDVSKIRVGSIPVLILQLKEKPVNMNMPALLWIHGGGYFLGMKEMVHILSTYHSQSKEESR